MNEPTAHILTEEGVTTVDNENTTPAVEVGFTLEQLRRVAKSIGRSLDSEMGKAERMQPGTRGHREAKKDYQLLDEIDVNIRSAISELMGL